MFAPFGAEYSQPILQWHDSFMGIRVVQGPVLNMLLRPEEVHLCSSGSGGDTDIREVSMSHDGRYVSGKNFTIPHLNRNFLIAIEAWAINPYYSAWKQPADR